MKIAYLANIRLPTEKAHGLQIMEMCRAFARAGHQVRLIVPRRKKDTKATPWEFYGMKPDFEIVEVPIYDFIPMDRWLGRAALWLNMLQFSLTARRAVEDFHPELVYSRDPWFSGLAPETRYVYEAHDFTTRVTPLHQSAWNRCARIVTVTEGLKRAFVAAGVPEAKLVVAHDGVDLATFDVSLSKAEARRSLGLPAEGFIAAYIGLLYPYKGADDLLEACAMTKQEMTTVFVGGHDEDIARLKARAEPLGLKDVRFVGRVPHAQVPLYLRAADVAVLPTRADDRHATEFLSPLKLFEYLAAGKPIVATGLSSTREVLDDRTAILVPPRDPAALAQALDALATDPARRARMEHASRAQAEGRTWVARAKSVLTGLPEERPLPTRFQRYRQPLLFAVLAFLLRAIYVVLFPQIRLGGGDELMYIRIADTLRGAHPAGFVSPAFYQPLFPLMLSALRAVFGDALVWIRLFQAVASAATVFLMVVIAERWSSRRTGLIAGLLGALSVPMILESGIIYTETLYTLFVTAAIALILWYFRQPIARRALAAGAMMALAGLTREIGFYLGITLAGLLAAIRRPRLLAAVFLLPILMAMGAIVVRNIGVPSPEATTAAPLLSKGYEATLVNPSSYPDLLRWEVYPLGLWRFIRYPFRLNDVSDEVSTKRVLLSGDWQQIRPEAPYILTKLMLILMHWIILLTAAYGLWRGRLDWRVKILFSVTIAFTAATIIVSGAARTQGFEYLEPLARYRFPVEPLIMILSAVGLERLLSWKK